jgi:hypothetical protein
LNAIQTVSDCSPHHFHGGLHPVGEITWYFERASMDVYNGGP